MAKKKRQPPNDENARKRSTKAAKHVDSGRIPRTSRDEQPEYEYFPIVAIGASAGGLAALKTFFDQVPKESGIAFVVVVHLSPEHKSHLAELLQPHVKIPVQQVTETVKLERNRVYVIPPNSNLNTIDTHLRLSELEARRQERAPIDHFFRTLAKTHDGEAIGVVLTGTGSDGTLGLRDIKQAGGLCIVQDPNDAEYDGMPQSAIGTGLVDLVLPIVKIPDAILRYTRTRPHVQVPKDGAQEDGALRQFLQKVFAHIRSRKGHDFSRYKRSTIVRRIQRRMQLLQIEEISAYLDTLRHRPEEVQALADDLLITVTNFFRDATVYEKLESEVVPQLFEGKDSSNIVRVWSVGCATGEEAYSLAILLLEAAGRRDNPPRLQVFASDLHERSLSKGRDGYYPGDIETDVSPERLRRFFVQENGGYRVRKEVREIVIFAPHNLLGDPPFSRLDLIACRNLMIYIQREAQRDIVELFHYALQPDGFLVLGTSETLDANELFETEDKKSCIFRKRNVTGPELRLPVFPMVRKLATGDEAKPESTAEPIAYGMLHQRIVEQYAPPSALVSPDDKLCHLSEHAGRYMVLPGGEPTANIFKLVREELRIELRAALHAAREDGKPARSQPIRVRFNGDAGWVVLHVRPTVEHTKGFALVIFEESETQAANQGLTKPAAKRSKSAAKDGTNVRLKEVIAERDLAQQRLQAIIEEFETSREEMKASNEELQSINEELRSTMEELETSKEELQSMNEELQTVNQENRHKVEELAQLSSDLQNLLTATDIATLFLDRELRIMRFTPRVAELFSVRSTDRGRPIADLSNRLGYDGLLKDVQRVLDKLIPIEREIEGTNGQWYITRVMPYRSAQDRIEGVVITFVDISARKRAEEALRGREVWVNGQREALEVALKAEPLKESLSVLVRTAVEALGRDTRAAFYLADSEGTSLHHVAGMPADDAEAVDGFKIGPDALACGLATHCGEPVLTADVTKDPRWEPWLGMAKRFDYRGCWSFPIQSLAGKLVGMFAIYSRQPREATEPDLELSSLLTHTAAIIISRHQEAEARSRTEKALRESEERFRMIADNVSQLAWTCDKLGNVTWYNKRWLDYTGMSFDEMKGWDWSKVQHPDHLERVVAGVKQSAETGEPWEDTFPLRGKDGQYRWFLSRAVPIRDEAGSIVRWFGTNTDVTAQLEAEEALHEADRHKDEFLATLAHELRNPLAPIRTGLEVLRASDVDAGELKDICSMIERQSAQLISLVDDLMDVARITTGNLQLRRQRVVLAEIVQNAIGSSRPVIDEAGHELILAMPEEPVFIDADPYRLAQVLSNLLNNAAKYTNRQGKIWLSAERANGIVQLNVRDNGVGIASDTLEQIFEMFVQIKSKDQLTSGLGVGLSLTRQIVAMHGGEIKAFSEGLGRGSEFIVTLPIVSNVVAAGQMPSAGVRRETAPLRVLVVDDNRDAAQMLSQIIRPLGHEVRIAGDGLQAIEVASEFRPSVVFMDLGMPKMNGYDAAQSIRQQNWARDVVLVAVTGWSQEKDRQQTKDAGFDHHLVKPVDGGEVQRLLDEIAGR